MAENYSSMFNLRPNVSKSLCLNSINLIPNYIDLIGYKTDYNDNSRA